MGPIDYSAAFGDSAGPLQAFNQALAGGQAIRQNVLQQEQKQLAFDRQKQFQTDVATLGANPTPQGIARLSVIYPEHAEQFKKSFDMLAPEQQKAKISAVIPVYAAIQSGRPDVAAAKLRETADAMDGSGQKDEAARTRAMADLIEQHPETGATTTGLLLASAMGPDKFAETFGKLGSESRAIAEAPADLAKKRADAAKAGSDASTAAVTAKYAESAAVKDLEKKGWDIKAIQEDIGFKKESNRIALMNAAFNKEGNQLKREELRLKIDDAVLARDTKVRERVADAEAGHATLQDAMNLLTEIRSDPDTLQAATGAGAWRGIIPGTKARTMTGKIEQLQNTLAASNLDKLKGAMSDKDILFLKNIASNLDRYQNEDQFEKELGKIEGILIRSEKQLRQKFGPKAFVKVPTAEPSSQAAEQRNVTVEW